MDKQNLKQQLKQIKRELKVIYEVTEMVASLDLEEILGKIVKIATRLTNADSCLIYLYDEKKKTLILRASKNPHPKMLGKIKMRVGEGITGWVARERKPVAISEYAGSDPRFKFFSNLPEDRYEAFLSVPILNKRGVVGVVNIQHEKRHEYSDNEILLLTAVGKIVGGVVENARLVEESLALKEALETRKILEKAKGILMRVADLSESKAHKRIQKQSMDTGRSVREIAEAIIMAEELRQG